MPLPDGALEQVEDMYEKTARAYAKSRHNQESYTPLYLRVDVVIDDSRNARIMEVEGFEPMLYFKKDSPASVGAFVEAIETALQAPVAAQP